MFTAFAWSFSFTKGTTNVTSHALCTSPPRQRLTSVRPIYMHSDAQSPPTAQKHQREKKGFVEELRSVAMRLHTKDQAPRQGQQEASALPIDQWFPSKHDFIQFLVDSRHVYAYFETELAIPAMGHLGYSRLANSGLERLSALDLDIRYLNSIGIPTPQPSLAATRYVDYLRNLARDKPESLLCHWYNYYFAHTAGGRMIGKLMQDRLFDGRSFEFYEWQSDVKQLLQNVRETVNDISKDWPRHIKDECLGETSIAFGYSGTVLQNLVKSSN